LYAGPCYSQTCAVLYHLLGYFESFDVPSIHEQFGDLVKSMLRRKTYLIEWRKDLSKYVEWAKSIDLESVEGSMHVEFFMEHTKALSELSDTIKNNSCDMSFFPAGGNYR